MTIDRSSETASVSAANRTEDGAGAAARRGRSGGKRRAVAFATAAAVLLALVSGAWSQYAQHRETVAAAEERREFVPLVSVEAVTPSGNIEAVSLPATTSAFAVANVFARASGYIGERRVDIGDRVKAGQLLAEIRAPELDHQIAQADANLVQLKAALRQAEANRDLAQVTWDRNRPLVSKGWVTAQQGTIDEQTVKAREAAVAVAQANIVAAQAQLQVLNQQKIYQQVVAPFDGVITQRNIDVGSLVQADATAGSFMFTIMQDNVIRTQVFVPQDQAFRIQSGVEALVHVPEMPDRVFPGTVTRTAEALQPGTRTLLTEVDIPNPDGALAPGIYCTIELHIPRKTPSFRVSADALIFNAAGMQVAVVENGVVHLRKIKVLRDHGREVEVNSGVRAGDQLILNPAIDLAEGSSVRIRPQPAPTS